MPENISKYSDDGEPQGTAGLPVISVLKNMNIENVLIIVTRYFGGTLLGKGGLIRAYTTAAKLGLENAEIYEKAEMTKIEVKCSYNIKDKVLFELEKKKYEKKIEFDEEIRIIIDIPVEELQEVTKNLIKLTENRIKVRFLS